MRIHDSSLLKEFPVKCKKCGGDNDFSVWHYGCSKCLTSVAHHTMDGWIIEG